MRRVRISPNRLTRLFIIVHLILTNVWSGRMYRALQQTTRPARELPMLSQGEFEMRFGRGPQQPLPQQPGREQTLSPDFCIHPKFVQRVRRMTTSLTPLN